MQTKLVLGRCELRNKPISIWSDVNLRDVYINKTPLINIVTQRHDRPSSYRTLPYRTSTVLSCFRAFGAKYSDW